MANTTTPQPASVIRTLHTRYERCSAEYNLIEAAETAERRGNKETSILEHQLRDALANNITESDALRHAILLQVPDSWTDALILQYHIWVEQDAQASYAEDAPDSEQRGLTIAMDTLFDFMACNIDADHERIGHDFQQACNMVFDKRRHRTGEVEA